VIFEIFLYTALTKTLAARDGWQERVWNARGKPEMFQFSCLSVVGVGGSPHPLLPLKGSWTERFQTYLLHFNPFLATGLWQPEF
jgi:hypothetical protein